MFYEQRKCYCVTMKILSAALRVKDAVKKKKPLQEIEFGFLTAFNR